MCTTCGCQEGNLYIEGDEHNPHTRPEDNVCLPSGQAVIEKNGVRIIVDDTISDELLMRLMKAMSNV